MRIVIFSPHLCTTHSSGMSKNRVFKKKFIKNPKEKFYIKFCKEFCTNTTLHGINHVMKPIFSKYERILWIVLFIIGVGGASFSCVQMWYRYTESTTVTVVDTTRYDYSNVPFPSVTLCDKSRIDWSRALNLTKMDFPGIDLKELWDEKLQSLLKRLAYATFGDFDFFDQLRMENISFSDISKINLTNLMLKLMRPCNEVFPDLCWFREKEVNCCKIFELQKTELGFCYSFNSDTSEPSRRLSMGWTKTGYEYWIDKRGKKRPRRTGQSGPWSGLRFTALPLNHNQMPPDGNDTTPGFAVIINDPKGELLSGYTLIPPGTFGSFPIWGDALIAKKRIKEIEPEARKCLFDDEDILSLPQGYYLAANCRADCFRRHTMAICNCVPDFIFPNFNNRGDIFPSCNAEGMMCLSQYNGIFTFEIPRVTNEFFENIRDGMRCNCLPDCTSQQYITQLISSPFLNNTNYVVIDVHFRLATCTLYRTDIVYDWLDIIVAFGGIAGLFLGASLMSGVELFYFLTVRFYYNWSLNRKEKIVLINKYCE